jgi:hypothetical protein
MRVIVCGGRFEDLSKINKKYLLRKVEDGIITELVCGMAEGIDKQAYNLLKPLIPVHEYPALWEDLSDTPVQVRYNKYGKPYNMLAGPNRNLKMAKNADAIVVFNGGTGTADMKKQAKKQGLDIIGDFMEVLY